MRVCASCRASVDLQDLGLENDLSTTLWMLPIIYIILMLLRFGLTAMFRPLFMLIKGDINTNECIFVTFAGLRGSASLIMGSAVVTQQFATYAGQPDTFSVRPQGLGGDWWPLVVVFAHVSSSNASQHLLM